MGRLVEGYRLKYQPSVGQLVVPDHKDNIIASDAAMRIAKRFTCQVSVSAGVHIDNASESEIQVLESNIR